MEAGKCPDCGKIYFSAALRPGKRVKCPYCNSVFTFLKDYSLPLDKAERLVNIGLHTVKDSENK